MTPSRTEPVIGDRSCGGDRARAAAAQLDQTIDDQVKQSIQVAPTRKRGKRFVKTSFFFLEKNNFQKHGERKGRLTNNRPTFGENNKKGS